MLPLLPSKRIPRALSACAAGLLLSLCFPNYSILPLLPVALIPLIAALDGVTPRRAFGIGYLFGLVFWAATLPWIAYTIRRFGGTSWPVAILALVITAGICAFPMGLMASAFAALAPRSGAGVVAAWGVVWVVQEGFRTYIWIFGGFPWALLANPLVEYPPLIATASVGGVLLTSFFVAALNAALYVARTRAWR